MGLLYTINENAQADKRALPGAEKRNLLRAALNCFAIHGFAKASLKKIGDEADMTAAMVNYYFGSKNVLYNEVLHMCYEQLLELVEERTKIAKDLEDFLSHLLYMHMEFARSYPQAATLIVKTSYSASELPTANNIQSFEPIRDLVQARFERGIQEGEFTNARLSVDELTEYFLGQAEYVLIRHVQAQNFQHKVDHAIPKVDDILKIFLRGTGIQQ